jgi:hypothetical protein
LSCTVGSSLQTKSAGEAEIIYNVPELYSWNFIEVWKVFFSCMNFRKLLYSNRGSSSTKRIVIQKRLKKRFDVTKITAASYMLESSKSLTALPVPKHLLLMAGCMLHRKNRGNVDMLDSSNF